MDGLGFLIVIVAVSAGLVYVGRMDAGAYTFLIGVIVGYMMQFLRHLEFGGHGDDDG